MKQLMFTGALLLFSISLVFSKGDTLIQTAGLNYALKMSYRNVATSDSDQKDFVNKQSGYKFADDIGFFYQAIFSSGFGIRTGLKYANKGFNIKGYEDFGFTVLEGENYKAGFHNLSIPVQLSYHKIRNGKQYHFYPFLELSYDVLLGIAKVSKNNLIPKESIKPGDAVFNDFRMHNLSAAFGMGWLYKIKPEWLIGFRAYFTSDILPVYKDSKWDTRLDASVVSLEMNYVIGKSKAEK